MATDLDGLIQNLNYMIGADMGFHKKANISETDVLGGDRTDTLGGGETHPDPDKEMDGSVFASKPVEESYDPNKEMDKNLEPQRQQEVMSVGQQSIDKSFSNNEPAKPVQPGGPDNKVEKAAMLAERILTMYKRAQEEGDESCDSEGSSEKKKEDELAEEDMSYVEDDMTEEESKTAGARAFYEMLNKEGADFLMKTAAHIDPEFQKYAQFGQGVALADMAIDEVLKKKASDSQLTREQEKRAYDLGATLAEKTIMKVAADLVAVKPVIQDLVANGDLSEPERDSLINALASADTLSPEVVQNSVQGLSNADAVAQAVLKALEGPQAANVVPPPSTTNIPTPEALPQSNPTIDSAPPETTTVDTSTPGGAGEIVADNSVAPTEDKELEMKAQELLDAVAEADAGAPIPEMEEDKLVIEAALRVLNNKKKKKGCK